jgi:hypothetical protein
MFSQIGTTPIPQEFHFLCIDNSNVRKLILSADHLSVQHVPCVLLLYENGRIEKFEKHNIEQWIVEQLRPTSVSAEVTSIDNLEIEDEPEERFTNQAAVEQAVKKKSIADVAAEMAAERDSFQQKK